VDHRRLQERRQLQQQPRLFYQLNAAGVEIVGTRITHNLASGEVVLPVTLYNALELDAAAVEVRINVGIEATQHLTTCRCLRASGCHGWVPRGSGTRLVERERHSKGN
jgi:hypothetical protein